jgi:hypothetical protein
MPSFKPDLKITVKIGEEQFSKKMPRASLTKIFEVARKWAVKQKTS